MNLSPPWEHEEREDRGREQFAEMVNDLQSWCPACGGSGMVMEYGPTDCPNLDGHRLLASLEYALPRSYFLRGESS